MNSRTWQAILKAVGAICIAIPAIVGAVQLWEWWQAPKAKLSGTFSFGEFVWPPALESGIPGGIPSDYSSLSTYWSGEVVNEGALQLSEVMVFLPRARFALLKREGSEPKFMRVTEMVSLGRLQPGEPVEVFAWSDEDKYFLDFNASKIRLTHERGVGSVDILVPMSTTATWQRRGVVLVALKLLLLVLLVALAVLLWPYLMRIISA